MDRPGTGASNLVNALLVIALFLLGIVLVSFLMFRKSLRRLVRVRTQPCQLDISSCIESKLEQLNRLPPSPITRVSFHDALQTQALTTAVDQYYHHPRDHDHHHAPTGRITGQPAQSAPTHEKPGPVYAQSGTRSPRLYT